MNPSGPKTDIEPLYEGKYDDSKPSVLLPKLIESIAEIDNRDPETLPPLYEVINPDVLTRIFVPFNDEFPRDLGCVIFPYDCYVLEICANGVFRVYDRNDIPMTPATAND